MRLFGFHIQKFITVYFAAVLQLSAVSSTALGGIDLGALPVERSSEVSIQLPYQGTPLFIVRVESSCSCLEVLEFPETLSASDNNPLKFSMTPNGAGYSEVKLTLFGVDSDDGVEVEKIIPVSVVGFEAALTPQLPDFFQLISTGRLHRELGSYQLIDIRGASSFQKAHIPESLEYTLDELLALEQNFTGAVVLLSDGLLSAREASLLSNLDPTLKWSWLEGGLPRWLREGRPVQGVWPSVVDACTISLQRWLKAGGASSSWVVADLTDTFKAGEHFFGHRAMNGNVGTPTELKSLVLSAQEEAMRRIDGRSILVVGDRRGLAYPQVESVAQEPSTIAVYYLGGGSAAYSKWYDAKQNPGHATRRSVFLSSSQGLSAPGAVQSKSGSRSKSGCRSCPK